MEFFTLIEKLKNLGIAAKLCSASNPTELCEEWNKFLSENSELVEEIKTWGAEFATTSKYIFKQSAVIEDSKEVVIIIRVCNDTRNVSECEICEDCADLETALKDTGETIAMAVAGLSSNYDLISEITAEEIFDYILNELNKEDADEEENDGGDEGESNGEDVAEEDSAKAADADPDYDA